MAKKKRALLARDVPHDLADIAALKEKAREMCRLLTEGARITQVCNMPGFPSMMTFHRWKKGYPEVQEMYDEAIKIRADVMHDQALAAVDEVQFKDDVPKARLKFDSLKWSAEISNPKVYGSARNVPNILPVQIFIDTGIGEPTSIIEVEKVPEKITVDE